MAVRPRICRLKRRMINENVLVALPYQRISDATLGYLVRWIQEADDNGIFYGEPSATIPHLYPSAVRPVNPATIQAYHNELERAGIFHFYRAAADAKRYAGTLFAQVNFQVEEGEALPDEDKSPLWQKLRDVAERGRFTYPSAAEAAPPAPDLFDDPAATCGNLPQTAAQTLNKQELELNMKGRGTRASAQAATPPPPEDNQPDPEEGREETAEPISAPSAPPRETPPASLKPQASSLTPPKRYIYPGPDGPVKIFVANGIGTQFGTFSRKPNGSLKRLATPHLPMCVLEAQAQADLDQFAKARRLIEADPEPSPSIGSIPSMQSMHPLPAPVNPVNPVHSSPGDPPTALLPHDLLRLAETIVEAYRATIEPTGDLSRAKAVRQVVVLLETDSATTDELFAAIAARADYHRADKTPHNKRQHAKNFFADNAWREALRQPAPKPKASPQASSPKPHASPEPEPLCGVPDSLRDGTAVWQNLLTLAEPKFTESQYKAWVRPLVCLGLDTLDILYLQAKNPFHAATFERECAPAFDEFRGKEYGVREIEVHCPE